MFYPIAHVPARVLMTRCCFLKSPKSNDLVTLRGSRRPAAKTRRTKLNSDRFLLVFRLNAGVLSHGARSETESAGASIHFGLVSNLLLKRTKSPCGFHQSTYRIFLEFGGRSSVAPKRKGMKLKQTADGRIGVKRKVAPEFGENVWRYGTKL